MAQALDPIRATSRHALRVRFCETDLMRVVHHANYLIYCEAARVDWLHKRGVSYGDWERLGVHLPVVDARLRFKQPARFEDELGIATTLVELTRVTVKFRYRVERGEVLLCEAETVLACVGHDLALRRLPEEVLQVFRSAELP
jgi:acyl-CoA thioester hydrolase